MCALCICHLLFCISLLTIQHHTTTTSPHHHYTHHTTTHPYTNTIHTTPHHRTLSRQVKRKVPRKMRRRSWKHFTVWRVTSTLRANEQCTTMNGVLCVLRFCVCTSHQCPCQHHCHHCHHYCHHHVHSSKKHLENVAWLRQVLEEEEAALAGAQEADDTDEHMQGMVLVCWCAGIRVPYMC